jgi:hypothetical protein
MEFDVKALKTISRPLVSLAQDAKPQRKSFWGLKPKAQRTS